MTHATESSAHVHLFTDGGCSRNPGPGGWAYILRHLSTGNEKESSGAEPELADYIIAIARETRRSPHLALGVSPRGSQALYRAAQAMAFLEGRTFCTPDDLKPLIVPVFAHRVVVNGLYASTLKKSEQSDEVLKEIIENVAVPV